MAIQYDESEPGFYESAMSHASRQDRRNDKVKIIGHCIRCRKDIRANQSSAGTRGALSCIPCSNDVYHALYVFRCIMSWVEFNQC